MIFKTFLVQPSIMSFCAPLFSKEDSAGWICVRDKRRGIIFLFSSPSQLHQYPKGHRVMAVIHVIIMVTTAFSVL